MPSAARRNIAAGYFNLGVIALIGLAVNPYLLSFLGATTFGIWRAVQRLLDFATVADGRSTQALKWVVAYRTGAEDDERNRRDVGAAVGVWLIWLPVLSLVSGGITLALPSLIKGVTGSEVHLVYLVGGILCANVVLTGLLWLPDSVLVGTNQGYRSMVVTTIVVGASNVVMVAAAWLSFDLVALAIIVLTANVINCSITYFIARRHVPWFGIRKPERIEVKSLFGFSGWVLIWAFVTKLFQSSELLLFSALVGAVAVTNYTFTSYVVTLALQVPLMTISALMPQLGAHLGRRDMNRAKTLIADSHQLTLAVVVIFGSGVLLFNRSFVTLWVGPERYLGDTVNALMVASFVQLALIYNNAQIQDTGMAIRGKVLIGVAGAVGSFGVAWVLFVTTHRVAMIYVGLITTRTVISVLFPALVRRLVPGVRFDLRRHLLGLMVLLASYLIGLQLRLSNIFEIAGAALLATCLLSLLTYWLLLTSETRLKVFGGRLGRRPGFRTHPSGVDQESNDGRTLPLAVRASSVEEMEPTAGFQDV